ncbi:adenosine kinase [Alphaproteobacteria bacterium]|nr:adenosine kinase [Alphaproteobacteria bacterium]
MKYDLLGIGNALVDCLGKCEEEIISQNNLEKGTMALVDSQVAKNIFEKLIDTEIKGGGSVANSMTGFSALGGKSAFIGRVGNDTMGESFVKNMNELNIDFLGRDKSQTPSGNCTVIVSPDGQRTMATYLGASVELSDKDLDFDKLEHAKIIYLEGYLFDADGARMCFDKLGTVLKKSNTKIAFTLSDIFVVERHRTELFDFVKNKVDILFANEEEIKYLMQNDDLDYCINNINKFVDMVVITKGENGAVVCVNNEVYSADAKVINVVDTTGAGDQFAGGFLYGLSQGYSINNCLEIGIRLASSVISHMGARLVVDAKDLIKDIEFDKT